MRRPRSCPPGRRPLGTAAWVFSLLLSRWVDHLKFCGCHVLTSEKQRVLASFSRPTWNLKSSKRKGMVFSSQLSPSKSRRRYDTRCYRRVHRVPLAAWPPHKWFRVIAFVVEARSCGRLTSFGCCDLSQNAMPSGPGKGSAQKFWGKSLYIDIYPICLQMSAVFRSCYFWCFTSSLPHYNSS